MRLIDTHSHIYQEDFDADLPEVIHAAKQAGITHILMPNIDTESVDKMHRLAETYPGYCLPMMGLHPTSVGPEYKKDLKTIYSFFSSEKYIAIGEIGLDLYWDQTFFKEQKEAFEEQLRWSIALGLPVVIHNRNAFLHVIDSIYKVGADRLTGIFHSFGGTPEELEEILKLERFYIGVNGVVTFKNSKASESIRRCPVDRMVVETDAPYLSPVPYRGKRNEPAYMVKTVEKLAELFRTDTKTIARQTSDNACRLFDL